MKTTAQTSFAERVGQAAGRVWRRCAHLEHEASHWLTSRGLAPATASSLIFALKLLAIGLLAYLAFWLTLILVVAVGTMIVSAHVAKRGDASDWSVGEQTDHKQNPGYHPNLHNDTPDPRYDD